MLTVVLAILIGLVILGKRGLRRLAGSSLWWACFWLGVWLAVIVSVVLVTMSIALLTFDKAAYTAEIETLKRENAEIEFKLRGALPSVDDPAESVNLVLSLAYKHSRNAAKIVPLEKELYDTMPLFAFFVYFGH